MANNKTNAFELEVLENWFNNTDIANMGDAAGIQGSATAGNLYIALFTSPVTDADLEASSFSDECNGTNYSGYARVAVPRNSTSWDITSVGGVTKVANDIDITFPQSAGTSAVITHAAVCKSPSGTTTQDMIIWGQLDNPLTVTSGVTPQFAVGNIVFTEE